MYRQPFIQILAFWQLDSQSQITRSLEHVETILEVGLSSQASRGRNSSYQSGLGVLSQLVLLRAFWNILSRLKRASFSTFEVTVS